MKPLLCFQKKFAVFYLREQFLKHKTNTKIVIGDPLSPSVVVRDIKPNTFPTESSAFTTSNSEVNHDSLTLINFCYNASFRIYVLKGQRYRYITNKSGMKHLDKSRYY